jgi:hypothetical protein
MRRKKGQKPIHRRTIFVVLVQYPLIALALFAVWWFFGWFYLTIGILLVAALFIFLMVMDRKAAKNPVNVGQGNWREYLETLLYRGYDRAIMMVEAPDQKRSEQFANRIAIIESPARERYMQFTKHITEKGATFQLQFARAPWSAECYQSLQELLKQREYHFEIWPVRPEDKFGPGIDEFIVVYLQQDLELAIRLTKLILLEVFKLEPSDTALVWFLNISPNKHEKVGF